MTSPPAPEKRYAPLLARMRDEWATSPWPMVVEGATGGGVGPDAVLCAGASLWSSGREAAARIAARPPVDGPHPLPARPGIRWVAELVGALRAARSVQVGASEPSSSPASHASESGPTAPRVTEPSPPTEPIATATPRLPRIITSDGTLSDAELLHLQDAVPARPGTIHRLRLDDWPSRRAVQELIEALLAGCEIHLPHPDGNS